MSFLKSPIKMKNSFSEAGIYYATFLSDLWSDIADL